MPEEPVPTQVLDPSKERVWTLGCSMVPVPS